MPWRREKAKKMRNEEEHRIDLLTRLDEIERHVEAEAIKPDIALGMMIKELARHVVHGSTLALRLEASERDSKVTRWLVGLMFATQIATAVAAVWGRG